MTNTRRLLQPFVILLALLFLFEAWLWQRLAPIVAWLFAHIPLRRLRTRLCAAIERIPPMGALALFAVPVALLLPMKFVGVWLLARGHWLSALGVLAFAKVASMGVTAFIFDLTRDKLLALPSFRWSHDRVMAGLAWAHRLIDPVKRRLRAALLVFSPRHAGRTLRLLIRIRRRAQREGGCAQPDFPPCKRQGTAPGSHSRLRLAQWGLNGPPRLEKSARTSGPRHEEPRARAAQDR
jgi:hypothetical protein